MQREWMGNSEFAFVWIDKGKVIEVNRIKIGFIGNMTTIALLDLNNWNTYFVLYFCSSYEIIAAFMSQCFVNNERYIICIKVCNQ